MYKFFPGAITWFLILLVLISSSMDLSTTLAENNHGNANANAIPTSSDQIAVTLGPKTIAATVANTDSSRIQGLLGWSQINFDQGMLLDFVKPGLSAIHMQGMKFPIDALWIDSNGVIRLIYAEIQPDSGSIYPSMFPVRYCLEVRSGFCRKYGIKEGQKVVFGP
jgi:uncharacterized protein